MTRDDLFTSTLILSDQPWQALMSRTQGVSASRPHDTCSPSQHYKVPIELVMIREG